MVQKPTGIDERLEQLREPVVKSTGSTDSERYLARLAEQSFLNLWSYPCPYRDQKGHGSGDGKELCDLLVVCGNQVVIFSEKTIDWPSGDIATAWSRWSKRAIRDSAKQTKGAERWLVEFPDRLFLDKACSVPFPIDLPPIENRRVHRVVVANGSAQAFETFSSGKSCSLVINPNVVGDSHWKPNGDQNPAPFEVGDIDPDGSFVHVLDESALAILMSELDTVRDFTDYLEKKAAFVRSGSLHRAQGEENLLAYYSIRVNSEGDHDFVVDDQETPITIDSKQYTQLVSDPRYKAKKEADKVSYFWDRLIETFTNHMLDGTSITLEGYDFDLRKNELGVRQMALVPRFLRRSHSQAVLGALEKGKISDKFIRVMISPKESKENETAFFILTLKYLDWMEADGGYEKYREVRSGLSLIYAKGLLERHTHLQRVVGISREPPDQGGGISEDMVCAEQRDWSNEERAAIRKDCENARVLQDVKEQRYRGEEFPEVGATELDKPISPQHRAMLNRKQRRALKSQSRKRKRN